ncbi:MAG: hypothetical protein IJX51_06700 [Clostridia bacterium]|nr:hypothetical protein [Clostridia bacterium]
MAKHKLGLYKRGGWQNTAHPPLSYVLPLMPEKYFEASFFIKDDQFVLFIKRLE